MNTRLSEDHYTGCLLGGAIGDAPGAPVEFMSLDAIRHNHGFQGVTDYCEYPDHTGEFTEDTQMTLFTAEGLLKAYHRSVLKGIGGAPVFITYQSYIRWLHTQGLSARSVPEGWGTHDIEKGWLLRQKALFKQRAPGNACLSSHLILKSAPDSLNRFINLKLAIVNQ